MFFLQTIMSYILIIVLVDLLIDDFKRYKDPKAKKGFYKIYILIVMGIRLSVIHLIILELIYISR